MNGFWLASYLALWMVVAGMAVLLVGALRQIGMLHVRLAQGQASVAAAEESVPPLEEDGPQIGSALPEWVPEWVGEPAPGAADGASLAPVKTLLMFLSPLCDTCQNVVEPLNALAADDARGIRAIAVFRSDRPAYEAFLKLFPLHVQSLRDHDRTLTMELGVHRAPFGLLYDEQGALVRKGLVEGEEDLAALLGDAGISDASRMHIYPRDAVAVE